MNDDELKNLLQSADRSAAISMVKRIDAAPIRRRASRRRLMRRGATAVALCLLLLPGWLLRNHWQRRTADSGVAPQMAKVDSPPQSSEELESMARIAQQTADAILLARNSGNSPRPAPPDDALRLLSRQVDQVSVNLVGNADVMARAGQSPQAALEYQRIVRLFPRTTGAIIAGRRLEQIRS